MHNSDRLRDAEWVYNYYYVTVNYFSGQTLLWEWILAQVYTDYTSLRKSTYLFTVWTSWRFVSDYIYPCEINWFFFNFLRYGRKTVYIVTATVRILGSMLVIIDITETIITGRIIFGMIGFLANFSVYLLCKYTALLTC